MAGRTASLVPPTQPTPDSPRGGLRPRGGAYVVLRTRFLVPTSPSSTQAPPHSTSVVHLLPQGHCPPPTLRTESTLSAVRLHGTPGRFPTRRGPGGCDDGICPRTQLSPDSLDSLWGPVASKFA